MVAVICVTYNVYTWTLLSSDWSFLDILHETLPYKWHIASMVEFQRILKTKAKDVNTYKQYSLLIYLHLFWIMHPREEITYLDISEYMVYQWLVSLSEMRPVLVDPEAEKSFVSFVFSQVFLQKSKSCQLDSKLDLKFENVFHLISLIST